MKSLLSYCVMGMLAIVMAGCVVTVAPGYTQEQGIYGYSYYYFPDYNFYYSPDINRYWWYQSGSWQYGQQLPPWYVINPNSTYIVINSRSINPTSYNNYYRNSYQRGYYRQQERRVYQSPPGTLPFYRPSNQPEQNRGREPAPENRNPNYNNNGERKVFPSQTPGSRQMQPTAQPQNTNNEGVRRKENQPYNAPQQKVETRQQPLPVPTQEQQKGRMPAASQQVNNPPVQNRTENFQQQRPQPQRMPAKRQEIQRTPQKSEAPPAEEKVQTRQQ